MLAVTHFLTMKTDKPTTKTTTVQHFTEKNVVVSPSNEVLFEPDLQKIIFDMILGSKRD